MDTSLNSCDDSIEILMPGYSLTRIAVDVNVLSIGIGLVRMFPLNPRLSDEQSEVTNEELKEF